MAYSYTYGITQDLAWQNEGSWQTPDTPFMSFAYWQALIDSKAIGEESGWIPLYLQIYKQSMDSQGAEEASTDLIAVMPLFIKGHHQGEYVFDHAWAEAYARYGEDYYPRLVTSVPYTPVTGERLWLVEGENLNPSIWQAAIAAVDNVAKQVGASSWHSLFMKQEQVVVSHPLEDSIPINGPLLGHRLLERQGCQFLWHNQKLSEAIKNDSSNQTSLHQNNLTQARPEQINPIQANPQQFVDFDDFLSTLTAKKRKNIRAERRKIAKQKLSCRIKTGNEIDADDWVVFYQCYAMTYAVRGRHPYLTPDFFQQIAKTMSENLMLAQAVDENDQVVASSLFFYDDPKQANATLYGRYWGALDDYDSLHFELCYYQGIEFAIEKGLHYFDPGTQGEHKLIRGFVPHKTHSLHRIYDPRFEPAIADFCQQDRQYMQQYRQQAHEALPFNIDNMPSFKG